jgi:hypothetical protein
MSPGTRRRDHPDYHRPLATYSEEERNRILESKAQRRSRAQLHKKLKGAVPGVFNVMQEPPIELTCVRRERQTRFAVFSVVSIFLLSTQSEKS